MRRAAIALTVGSLLAGCGAGSAPLASAAAQDVHTRSVNAGFAMTKAGRSSSAVDHARRVAGDTGTARIEALEAVGDGIKGHVLLRISSRFPAQGFSSASQATACFRYDMSDTSGGIKPHEVRCPDKPPLVLPEPSPDPTFPPDSEARLRRALASSDAERAVQVAFAGSGTLVRTTTMDGVVAAAVMAGRGECIFARRLPSRAIEVWVLPRVLAQPGELGCDVEFAVTGAGKQPPH